MRCAAQRKGRFAVDFFSWQRFADAWPKILPYFSVTLQIVVTAEAAGILLGLLIALARIERVPALRQIFAVYVSFMRGTPMLVQLLVVYYGLPFVVQLLTGIDLSGWNKLFFVCVTYGLNQGAFLSEIFRGAIGSIPAGQKEAAWSVGLTNWQAFRRIVLPQAARVALPGVGINLVGLFQETSLACLIGVVDLVGRAQTIGTTTGHLLESYVVIAIIFVAVSVALQTLFRRLDGKLNHSRERGVSAA